MLIELFIHLFCLFLLNISQVIDTFYMCLSYRNEYEGAVLAIREALAWNAEISM